jgi:hypothetical protein
METLTEPTYSHSPALQAYAAALIVAGVTYGPYSRHTDEVADALVAAMIREDYKEFKLLNLLDTADNDLSADQIGGDGFAEEILAAIRRACYRAGNYCLWGPEERAHFNNLPN